MKLAKLLIKNLAARAGYQIQKLPPRFTARLPCDSRYGLEVLGYLVDELISRRDPKTLSLLQIGANDGVDEDPVYDLLVRHPIPALLCEPLHDTFIRLEQTYSALKHVDLARCAVGPNDGELELYRISPDAGLHRYSKTASINLNHVKYFIRHFKLPDEVLVRENVPCMTVRSLLNQNGWQTADIVVMDTEGMDHLICSQVLELSPPPVIIQFEYCNSPGASVRDLMERLTTLGYRFVRSGIDITATTLS